MTPRHDVNSPGALVMPRPNASHQVTAVQTSEFCCGEEVTYQMSVASQFSKGLFYLLFRIWKFKSSLTDFKSKLSRHSLK